MKPTLLTVCASPRKKRTTLDALRLTASSALNEWPELSTLEIDLAEVDVGPCTGCWGCKDEFLCTVKDDWQEIMHTIDQASVVAILFATPVYMGSMTAQGKAFWDRSIVFRCKDFAWKNVVGGAIATGGARNGGQELTIQGIHAAMGIHDMVIASDAAHFGGTVWTRGSSTENDEEGVGTLERLGRRVAEVARALQG